MDFNFRALDMVIVEAVGMLQVLQSVLLLLLLPPLHVTDLCCVDCNSLCLCFGLVAYRDRHDQFLVRSHDLTNDLSAFQGVLNALQAAGGGDYPEAMNEALHETVHRLSWRGDGATRLVVLIADAPPHLDYGGPQYDDDMMAALGKGIKIFSVGASGLDKQGEYIQRQMAQYTGGKFVFLTYDQARNPASGPGRETVHDVKNYSVDTLDRLIVRLVGDELGKLARGQ